MTAAQDDREGVSAVDEVTPLLAVSEAGPLGNSSDEPLASKPSHDDDKPLPVRQILLLCYIRLLEPLIFFSIFPFINQMIWETGTVQETDVGFYSGLIESLFSLTQMVFMISWGRAADRFGRKPVLVFSLVGLSISAALFGLSRTVWEMILFRCIAGVFSGTVVAVRAMISENSTPKTQARAFSYFAFANNMGIFLGPLTGGALSHPAEQYASVFGKIGFFKEYPYALPTFVTGLMGASAFLVAVFFVEETLHRKDGSESTAAKPKPIMEILKSPGVAIVLYIYSHTMLIALGYTAVLPVFFFTSPALGGFGFTPFMISVFIGLAGLSQSIWTLIIFPPIHRRLGSGNLTRVCTMAWLPAFAFYSICNLFLRQDWTIAFWVVAPTSMVIFSGISMAYTTVQLALNDISPSPATLGTLNAVSLAVNSGIRAVAPAFFASLFATSVRLHLLGGQFIWLILGILAVILLIVLRWFPKKADGVVTLPDDDEGA